MSEEGAAKFKFKFNTTKVKHKKKETNLIKQHSENKSKIFSISNL